MKQVNKKEKNNRREEYEDRMKVRKKTKKEHKRKEQRREERKEKEKKTGPRSNVCFPLLLLKLPLPPCVLDLLLLAASAAAACCWSCRCSLLLRLVLLMHAHFCYYGTPRLRCLWLSASNCFSQPNHAICTDKWELKE